jgi:hypothetical protein
MYQQRGGIGCKPIGSFGLCEKAVDGERVAKHSDTFLWAKAVRRDRVRSGCSGSDVGENFELDGYGCTNIKKPVRAPKANAICKRLVGTIRRECLDLLIPPRGATSETSSDELVHSLQSR